MSQNIAVELTAAMALFDHDSTGNINATDIGPVVRALGLNPSESEIKTLAHTVEKQFKGKINSQGLYKLIEPKVKDFTTSNEDLREAMQAFDRHGTQTVDTDVFADTLCELGEPLPAHLVNEVIRNLDKNGDGKINIDDICDLLSS